MLTLLQVQYLAQEVLGDVLAVVGVDQSQGVQATALGVARAGRS